MRKKPAAGLIIVSVLLGTAVFGAPPSTLEPGAIGRSSVPVTSLTALRELTPAQAAQGRPVRLLATVTYYHHEWDMLFVQDAASAAFVYIDHRQAKVAMRPGQLVEISGKTVPGDFEPSIAAPSFRPLEYVGLPAPQVVNLQQIATAELDGYRVEVRGIVQSAENVDDLILLTLKMEGSKLKVHVQSWDDGTDFSQLVDAGVRVRGVATTLTNEHRQFVGSEIWANDWKDVLVDQPAAADPFAGETHSIDSLRRYAFAGGQDHRIEVEGTVTLHHPGRGVFLQDDTDGIFVQTAQELALRPGDRVEAAGFIAPGGQRPILENATVRRIGASAPPVPVLVSTEQALGGNQDSRLVKIRGRFVGRIVSAGESALVLQEGDTVFNVRLQEKASGELLSTLEAGSLLEVVGVCSLPAAEAGAPRAFQIWARSPADLSVLQRPSWWTAARVRGLLVALSLLLLAAVAWGTRLKRHSRVELHRKEEALRESEERFALAVRGTNDGIWDWDLRADRVYYSPRWKSMLGYREEEIGDSPEDWFRLIHHDDIDRVRTKLRQHRRDDTALFENEHRLLHKDGTYRWVLNRGFAQRDEEGVAYRLTGAQTDVTDRRAYDALTGLPNKALFVERLEKSVTRGRGAGGDLFAVLFLDLDRFKLVNDSLGHLAGDRLLVTFAERLEGCIRPGDMAARFGGDEFAILVDDIDDAGDAARVAERIQLALTAPFNLGGPEVYTSGSIGIALSSTGYDRAEDLLRDADTAMYRAKAGGRARYEVFDAAMRDQVTAFMRTQNDLRRALERDELRLHYQPIVDLAGRDIVAFEALVRWQHPDRGLLYPGDFVAVAEETGLIVTIGDWVLRRACRHAAGWGERHTGERVSVSVNLSARQVSDPDLVMRVREALRDSRLPPAQLVLEITESAILETGEGAIAALAELKSLGVRLHLDDFGTGYSSLSYLHRLPIDALKIDRSFVATMVRNEQARAIVRSILNLADGLRLSVIAEGVETDEQALLLRELGCPLGQGFLFSAALEPQMAASIVASGTPGRVRRSGVA